jgi:hypothetical protein
LCGWGCRRYHCSNRRIDPVVEHGLEGVHESRNSRSNESPSSEVIDCSANA